MTDAVGPEPGRPGPGRPAPGRPGRRDATGRHSRDGLRALAAFAVTAACALVVVRDSVNPVEAAIAEQLRRLPDVHLLWTAAGWLGTPWAIGVAAVTLAGLERFRMALAVAVSGAGSALLARVLSGLAGARVMPEHVAGLAAQPHGPATVPFPAVHVAVAAALAGGAGPYLPRRYRNLVWAGVVLVAVSDVVSATQLPLDVFGAAFLGLGAASTAQALLGAPGRRTSADVVVGALESAGLRVGSIRRLPHERLGPLRYVVRTESGQDLAVKVVHRVRRRLGLLYRLRRRLRSLGSEVEPRLSSPWHEADHEALVTLLADRAGVRTPRMTLVSGLEHGPAIVVRGVVEGRPLSARPGAGLGPDTLDDLWRQVRRLHRVGIAHHDLRDATLQVDGEGRVWVLDFSLAEAQATADHRAQDVAELLVCLTARVGLDRAVESATRNAEAAELRRALPYLHPLALPPRIRAQLDDERGVLAVLRQSVADRTGTTLPSPGWPIRPSTIVSLCLLGAAVYLLLPQISSLEMVARELRHAEAGWVAVAVAAALVLFPLGAVGLAGASPLPLPFWRTTGVQVAAALAGRITPGGLGAAGVNYVYLQRLGLARSGAAGVVALNRTTGAVVAAASVGVGVLVVGSSPTLGRVPVPPLWSLLAGAAALMVLAGVVAGLPPGRRALRSTARVLREIGATVRQPARAAQLLGGAVGFQVVNGLALAASLAAFGADPSVVTVIAIYLVGGNLGSAAPTPGGLGAVEAALVAGLTATGTPSSAAVAAVLTYRLATFWLPVAFGPIVSRRLQRSGLI